MRETVPAELHARSVRGRQKRLLPLALALAVALFMLLRANAALQGGGAVGGGSGALQSGGRSETAKDLARINAAIASLGQQVGVAQGRAAAAEKRAAAAGRIMMPTAIRVPSA